MNESREEYSFVSHAPAEVKFVNVLSAYSYFGILAIVLLILFDNDFDCGSIMDHPGWPVVIVFAIFCITFDFYTRRFARSITIDRSKGEVKFCMLRNDNIVLSDVSSVEKVHLDLYITFFVKGKKVMLNGARNEQLVDELRKWFTVTIGIWGKLLRALGF